MSNYKTRIDLNKEIMKYIDCKGLVLNLSTKGQIDFEEVERFIKLMDFQKKPLELMEAKLEKEDRQERIHKEISNLDQKWGSNAS